MLAALQSRGRCRPSRFGFRAVGPQRKSREYKTAKQALIAAATHVAVVERQQMDKAAYNSINTCMSTENPRAPPMADFATQTARAQEGGWSERF